MDFSGKLQINILDYDYFFSTKILFLLQNQINLTSDVGPTLISIIAQKTFMHVQKRICS